MAKAQKSQNNAARRHNKSSGRVSQDRPAPVQDRLDNYQPRRETQEERIARVAAEAVATGRGSDQYRTSGLDYLHSAIRAVEADLHEGIPTKLKREVRNALVKEVAFCLHLARNHAMNGHHSRAAEECQRALNIISDETDASVKRVWNLNVKLLDRAGRVQHTRVGEIVGRFLARQQEGAEVAAAVEAIRAEEKEEIIEDKYGPEGTGVYCTLQLHEKFQFETDLPRLVSRVCEVKVRKSA